MESRHLPNPLTLLLPFKCQNSHFQPNKRFTISRSQTEIIAMSEETTKKVEELSINEQAAAPGEGPVVLGYVNVVCSVDRSNW